MKRLFLAVPIYLTCLLGSANAVFVSGSTGVDGAFSPTANTELQLPADGIFNFTTVNIPSGVTVTFKKNASNTPVYILATGDVTIAGTININGGSTTASTGTAGGKGGPGGYDGGNAGASGLAGGKGLGSGGGGGGASNGSRGGGGGYGTPGAWAGGTNGAAGSIYGNPKIMPLLGGSGGGGEGNYGCGGGGGGGAILIASSTTISITGSISANGGNANNYGGGGSGGAIKLQANVISGNGTVTDRGGTASNVGGGAGRIRLEAYTNNRTSDTDPPYTFGIPESVFIANAPTLTITSIAGSNVPASPTGSYAQPDIALPSTTANPVTVAVSGANIPVGTAVMVRAVPQYGSETTGTSTLSGTVQSSTASVNVNISTTYSNVLSAEATYTVTGMYYDGEEIDRVRVAATMGGISETTYITKSG